MSFSMSFPFPALCGGGVVAAPTNEHNLVAASSQYLSITDANFGAIDLANFAIFARVTVDIVDGTTRWIMVQWGNANNVRSWALYITAADLFSLAIRGAAATSVCTATTTIVAGTEYDVYATWNGTTQEIFVNGTSENTATPGYGPQDVSGLITIGARGDASGFVDGTIHQPTLFSGGFPAVGDLGSVAAPVAIHTLPNVFSALDADTSVVADFELATDWTNNNSVTTQVRS